MREEKSAHGRSTHDDAGVRPDLSLSAETHKSLVILPWSNEDDSMVIFAVSGSDIARIIESI